MSQTHALADTSKMLTPKDVAEMLRMSTVGLWRLSNSKNESRRIPSYKVGGKRLYKYEEIIHYLDNHKTTPNKK